MSKASINDAIGKLLSQEIDAIESHRNAMRQEAEATTESVDRAWRVVLVTARDLKTRVVGQPRLRYFNIARDGSEITISFRGITDQQKDIRNFSLHRQHPEGRHRTTDVIWCHETYQDERRFRNAEDVIRLMVKFCAVNMV